MPSMIRDIDLLALVEILIDKLSEVQVQDILQEISNRYENGCCPICGSEKMPYDKQGKRIGYMEDATNAEWHEVHEVDCMVTLLEELRDLKKKEEK